jgi:hypothetical protein
LIDKTEKIEDPEGVTEQEKYLTMIRNINECVVTGFPKMLKFLKL